MAFAVTATMGTLPASPGSRRIAAVASNPSICGIWQSIKIKS
jgi:hypothetical protein